MPIEVKNLNHIYMAGTPFEAHALKDICLRVDDGEFIGIIGHTGSGKSTLVSHLNALTPSPAGTVIVNGMDLGLKGTRLSDVRRTVGLVFQYPEYQLFEETVEKDISFGPNNLHLPADEVKARVVHAMEQVRLAPELAERSPFELSGGQKRRVAIAGVLAMQPSILILDEPAAGLDPAGRREILDMLVRIHSEGTTVIMVSHSMDDVGRLCDRLYVLSHGEIALSGTPAEVFTHGEALRGMGLDVPECAKLAAALRAAGLAIPDRLYREDDLLTAILSLLGKDGDRAC